MNNLFVNDLVVGLENEFDTVKVCDQQEVRSLLEEMEMCSNFPMICYEYTEDSSFTADISDSKFLNDACHKGTWIVCIDDDVIKVIINLNSYNDSLEIDTLEVNVDMQRMGLGSNIVSLVENMAELYYNRVMVSPYDTNAINFWNNMEYTESRGGYLTKEL